MLRYDIINTLIDRNDYQTYLEVGTREPEDCFNRIVCETKHSLDPCFEVEADVRYKYTSDDFFSLLEAGKLDLPADYKWDIIFIDGLHISTQVDKDIANALNHLSENGSIVMHDCSPETIHHAREDFYDKTTPAEANWNGTTWKAFYKYRATRTDLRMAVVDTDWGVGLIQKGNQVCCPFDNPFYEYNQFAENKKEYLNLISIQEFLQSW